MKDEIKRLFREMMASGELEIELPAAAIEAVLKSNPQIFTALLEHERIFKIGIQPPKGKIIKTGPQHKTFPDLICALLAHLNAYLVGPAGSGKTTAGEQAALALDVPFFFTGAINSEYKLTGFIDSQGRLVSPAFRRAYEHGGLFLFDEIDASMPQAVLAFNAAIANGMMDFPDGCVKKHEKFHCMAAANTYGVGANGLYVGRNQMDGATIDRFAFIEWGYDEPLEMQVAYSFGGKTTQTKAWVEKVQLIRKQVSSLGLKHIISTRASNFGSALLASGMEEKKVEAMVLWKGLDRSTVEKIRKRMTPDMELEAASQD